MDLSKIHSMARACYNAADEETRKTARKLFNEMDKNGDGTVGQNEFIFFCCKHLENTNYDWIIKIFGVLDDDKSGSLDFWEAVTFYYIMQSGHVSCNDCGTLLFDGNYFVCDTCFRTEHSYNLCIDCYGTNSSKHQKHPKCDGPPKFVGAIHLLRLTQAKLDQANHSLRLTQAKLDQQVSTGASTRSNQAAMVVYSQGSSSRSRIAGVALQIVSTAANVASSLGYCSIM